MLGRVDGFIRAASIIYWGLMLAVFCVSHMAFVAMLPSPDAAWGFQGLLLFLLLMTQLSDVMHISGRSIGGPEIVPAVSLGKTWSGFIGGIGGATIFAGFTRLI